ncbi:hypothetical protein AMK28_10515 [Streptomyces sp. CB02115]|nr:hypothetical protein AMK28_10515 [Streptomyces sp. CB02115]
MISSLGFLLILLASFCNSELKSDLFSNVILFGLLSDFVFCAVALLFAILYEFSILEDYLIVPVVFQWHMIFRVKNILLIVNVWIAFSFPFFDDLLLVRALPVSEIDSVPNALLLDVHKLLHFFLRTFCEQPVPAVRLGGEIRPCVSRSVQQMVEQMSHYVESTTT